MTWRSILTGVFLAALTLFVTLSRVASADETRPMAIGLAAVHDWSVQQPFLDVMKTARPWIGHKPGQWGGEGHDDLARAGLLDDNGWPLKKPHHLGSIGTVILTDMPEQAQSLAGRYRLRFEGNGIVEASGRASNIRYGKGEVLFDYTPGPGPVEIRIQRTDPAGKGDYVRNISVVKLDHIDAHDAGWVFNPDWLNRMRGFSVLRFMDWMQTNNSTQSTWDARPKRTDYTWAQYGVPAEIMVALAKEIDVDLWFNMPHLADDAYVRAFATLVRDALPPGRKTYVEFSNEVWNWQFDQTRWADTQATARWAAKDTGMQFYGLRAAQVARLWSEVFADQADARLINVISSQTGWTGLEQITFTAPLWVSETPGNPRPVDAFDAYAVTGYFGGILGREDGAALVHQWIANSRKAADQDATTQGLAGDARVQFIEQHQYDGAVVLAAQDLRDGSVSGVSDSTLNDLLTKTLPYHAGVAQDYGLDLIMYEGGSHVVGLGAQVDDPELTAFFTHLNYTTEMGALYDDLIRGWYDLGGQLFNAYSDVFHPSKWGSWGALRYLEDDNPRWNALVRLRGKTP